MRQVFGADTPRNRHYGEFYGLTPPLTDDDRPLLVVHGNCQADSLRILLEGHYGDRVRTVRLVPAHELLAADVPALDRVLARASYLVTQPIVEGYRGLAVGTKQLTRRAAHARTAVVPVLRWAGLHPTQVIVRSAAGDPPSVPYHDLRTIAAALGDGSRPQLTPRAVEALRELTLRQLTQRIAQHDAIDVTQSFLTPGRRSTYVINHPTNAVLTEVAHAIGENLGLGQPRDVDPGRVLLGRIVAPIDPHAGYQAGLDPSANDLAGLWHVDGVSMLDDDIAAAQLAWYRTHPEALDAASTRHAVALRILEENR